MPKIKRKGSRKKRSTTCYRRNKNGSYGKTTKRRTKTPTAKGTDCYTREYSRRSGTSDVQVGVYTRRPKRD